MSKIMVIEVEIYYCYNINEPYDNYTHTCLFIILKLIRNYYLYIPYRDSTYYSKGENSSFYLLRNYRNKYIPKKELIDFINKYMWCGSIISKSEPVEWISRNIPNGSFIKRQEITIDSSLLYFSTTGIVSMSYSSGFKCTETVRKIVEDSGIRFIEENDRS